MRMGGSMCGRVGPGVLAVLLMDRNCGAMVAEVLAAGPVYWQHEPFNAQLNPIGGMVGGLPRPPPVGLTCASMGPRAQEEAQATTYRVNVRGIGPA